MDTDKNSDIRLNSSPVMIGEWTYYPDLFKLVRSNQEAKLEPRSAQLLMYLVQNPGKTCSRESLIENAWPGMVVGDEVLTSAINKLRKAFEDRSQEPQYIETIPKAGYRLIAEIQLLETAESKHQLGNSHTNNAKWYFGGAILLICAVVILIFWLPTDNINQKPEDIDYIDLPKSIPVIAVLPFENLSTDEDQGYFADGITEDIITDLSIFNEIRVLAGTTTFKFRGQPEDLTQQIDDLGISHVLEGSVRKSGKQLRISARLINTENGQNIWAERFDRTLEDIFEVQDNVTRNIVNALSIHLSDQEKKVYEMPTTSSFEAYDLYLKGRNQLNQRTKETDKLAMEYYLDAIAIDPNFARAYGAMAVALIRTTLAYFTNEEPQKLKDKALFYALKAVELNANSQNTHWALGFTHLYRKEIQKAEQAVTQSLKIAPNYADGLALLALIKNYVGEAEESINLIQQAKLLNPDYTWDYLFNLGWSYYTLKQYDQAGEYLSQALERNENARIVRLLVAANYIGLGLEEDAQWEIEELLVQFPKITIKLIEEDTPIMNKENLQVYLNHLRKAGLPES